ncbi:hypothetical protein BIV23_39355 [Streptomyces monashensis]|uniref:Secreted protein n=1 Tax=Streptomyces monashensis TaxID=1678012 RepID=A0A1S2PEN0_9ACTN|nr:hypothetical protein BIV23_39355 [Streptomyces monashensis]
MPLAGSVWAILAWATSTWSALGGGTTAETSPWALSLSRQVGFPALSRTMCPPAGSAVPRSTPASASARLLTRLLWKSEPLQVDRAPGVQRVEQRLVCDGARGLQAHRVRSVTWSQPSGS